MKKRTLFSFYTTLLITFGANAASMLQATGFPKTFSDLSFSEQLDAKAEGYEPFEGLTAYQAIKLIEMEDAAHDEIETELEQAGINQCPECDENGNMPLQQEGATIVVRKPEATTTPQTTPASTISSSLSNTSTANTTSSMRQGAGYCSLRHPKIPQGQTVPLGQPVNMLDMPVSSSFTNKKTANIMKNTLNGLMCSPYGCREKIGNKAVTRPHMGVDVGCTADFYRMPIYATADGVVSVLTRAQKGKSSGNYIAIDHGKEWTSQYMHLDEILVTKGQKVSAGCLIGYMGHTGGNADQKNPSMGKNLTHLHYEILYSGRASQLSAPNGRKIPIVREKACNNGKGFKTKIKPNELMTYYDT